MGIRQKHQVNAITYPKNHYEFVMINDFEKYDVKSESPVMSYWSI